MPGVLDAATFRRALARFEETLSTHRDELNSLNVFPVPDGDTGTNLSLTMEAVCSATADLPPEASMDEVCDTVSRASLMAARGNSGVILSQVLRGLCETLAPAGDGPGGATIAAALHHASTEAYQAVARPAEGTVLTVLREGAEAAEAAVRAALPGGTPHAGDVLEAALAGARASLARTTSMLPQLAAAGVVDAGGKGVVLFLDAVRSVLREVPLSEPVGPAGPVGEAGRADGMVDVELAFEVQYLLEAPDAAVAELRRKLDGLGDSVVVVGGGGLFNVHVHTNEPDAVVDSAHTAGRPSRVTVVDLRDRIAECMAGHARSVRVAEQATGMLAMADGEGVAAAFRSLGAAVVSAAGLDEMTLAERVTAAAQSAAAPAILVLPTGPDQPAAAGRAAAESSKDVRVVGSASIPAGLSAATACNPDAGIDANLRAADEAAGACRSGVADADGVVATAVALVAAAPDAEVLTLIAGAAAAPHDLETVAAELRSAFPALKVEAIPGGQPGPAFVVGLE